MYYSPMSVAEKPRSERRHKFNYGDVLIMAREGLLNGTRVELRNGELIEMSPQNPPHALSLQQLDEHFNEIFRGRAKVFCQLPLRLEASMKNQNLPNPDLMLLKRKRYTDHPLPEDVYLLIEVSDTTLDDDLGDKLYDYAKVGIPEYWVFDIKANTFKVFTEPTNGDYSNRLSFTINKAFAPQAFPEEKHTWLL
jgi:Uma2 family endonuclease